MNYTQFLFTQLFLSRFPQEIDGNIEYDVTTEELFEIIDYAFSLFLNESESEGKENEYKDMIFFDEYMEMMFFFDSNQDKITAKILEKHNGDSL